ncbi:glycosyltransferase involved in cell wall biosynthesis [Neolewinella xylanilytica]|uniref:Glycosyltransferase involved in cell wall biosynthesis n=1 Tax=Neolewinella xylanilytica TaxID=1514080 RepID=A0A2S6I354_9BACT|nr:glycosyltransferase family 4 protein [Neolewinella xylanilytica]PPK85595.1 glycosyltransferase involved in cell wall biosynthesis [Neolewinella xylanilytica]
MSAPSPSVLVISDYRDSLNAIRPEGQWWIRLSRDYGYRITIMTPRRDANYLEELEAAGVRIIDWHPESKFGRRDSDRIRRELDEGHYDMLHLFNSKAVAAGLRAARGWSGKVATYRGYCGNVHWWDPTAYLKHLNPRVDLITCVSQAVKDDLDGQLFFDSEKTVVVSKGHDPAWYADVAPLDLHREFNIPAGRLVLIVVANGRTMKGMEYLGTAIRRLPAEMPLHLLFVGRDLDNNDLRADLADSPYHDEEDFTFAGWRPDVLRLIAAADMSLLPSVKGEGLSKVLLESMFLGRPTIMTDIGGNRGLGIDGETALIVPPRDEYALVEAIVRLVEDSSLREQLGPAGAAFVSRHYRSEQSARDLDRAYRRLLVQ